MLEKETKNKKEALKQTAKRVRKEIKEIKKLQLELEELKFKEIAKIIIEGL